jgi:hypothetical protein
MKNHTNQSSTSQQFIHNNSLWQEIPEDCAETIKGGSRGVLFLFSSVSSSTKRRLVQEFEAELAT